jgi:hypothetical protein
MATPAQVLANKANAQLSTGPRTPEGRARSAANSTSHGLSAAFRVLPHEDQEDFDELVEDLVKEHEPSSCHQVYLVEQIAKTWWTVARAQRLETRALEYLAGLLEPSPDDPDSMIIAKMFKSNPNAFTTIQRYLTQNQNHYNKLWRELKAAKQIENEAKYVDGLSKVVMRTMQAPPPDHPAASGDPIRTQYGYLPQRPNAHNPVPLAASA